MNFSPGNPIASGTVVVIGGSGFVGSYIVKRCLQKGYKVKATHFHPLSDELKVSLGDQVEWIQLDVHNLFDLEETLEGADYVVHTAALVSFNPKKKKEAFRLAREGTMHVTEAAKSIGIKKLIHISSTAALGRKKLENRIDESTIFSHGEYDTTYGLSKFLAEQEVWRAWHEGLPVTILNPSMVIGAGKWGQSSTKIITTIDKGVSYYPSGINGFVDVRDVAEATVRAIEVDQTGERFIISSENLSYQTVFSLVGEGLKMQTKWKLLTPQLSSLAWRWEKLKSIFTGAEPSFSRDQARSMQTLSYYDASKSVNYLGMEYRGIEKTILETTQKYMESKKSGRSFSMLDF